MTKRIAKPSAYLSMGNIKTHRVHNSQNQRHANRYHANRLNVSKRVHRA